MSESGSGEPVDSSTSVDKDFSECPTCGEVFQSGRGVSSHHIQAHGESIAGVELTCEYCNEGYRVKRHRVGDSRFCSHDCKDKWQSEKWIPHNKKEKQIVECEYCNDKIEVCPSKAEKTKFCNMDCKAKFQSKHRSGENHPSWEGGLVSVDCEWCGGEYKEKPCREDRTRFCSTDCLNEWKSENLSGENSPRWKGGYSSYRGRNWLSQREKALVRDGRECQHCASEENLQVHHIIPFRNFEGYEQANKIDNLTTLCHKCHQRVEKFAPLLPPSIH